MNAPAATPPSADPDWDKLEAVCAQAERHRVAGTMTPDEYRRLLDEARDACHGHTEFLEALVPYEPTA
jgi:hypothetical protein